MIRFYIIFILVFIIPQLCSAIPQLTLEKNKKTYSHFKVEYLIELSNKPLSINEIKKMSFNKVIDSAFSLGYVDKPVWFRFNIKNTYSTDKEYILILTEMFHKTVDLYQVSNTILTYHAGLSIPLEQRKIKENYPAFPIKIKSKENIQIYIKVESIYGFFGEFQIKSPEVFYSDINFFNHIFIFYFAAVLLIALYNLFIYIYLKEKIYIFYVMYVLSFALWIFLYRGFSMPYIDKDTFDLLQITIPTFLIMLILFSQAILETKKYLPLLNKILNVYITLILFSSIWMLLSLHDGFHFMNLLITPLLPLLLIGGILTFNQGYKIAKIYIIVLFIFFIGMSLVSLLALGLIPYTKIVSNGPIIGSFFEIILFSLLLAYRINLLHESKIATQKNLLNFKENESLRLTKMVEEKTIELNTLNQKLTLELREKKELEKILIHHATTDFLTGILNRRAFFDICNKEVNNSKQYHHELSFLIIDIDYFKQINDKYGHLNGDIVLINLVKKIQNTIKETDILGRIGGEEFAVLLPQSNLDDAIKLATRIKENVAKSETILEGNQVNVTVSIGIGELSPQDSIIQTVLKRADIALFKAKERGRNQVCCED